MKIINSNIVTAFDEKTIGTKVTDSRAFYYFLDTAVRGFDFASQRVPGQGFINFPDRAVDCVSAGVGFRSVDPEDYVLREHRGTVHAYLKRVCAAKATGVAVIVYTVAAYLADPDITPQESVRVKDSQATHVLVAVLAFAGPKPALSPFRFVANLAGGNKEALVWTADEIRAKASDVMSYDEMWSAVAD